MKKYLITVFFFSIIPVSPILAQDLMPSEEEIIIPPMILEIEDISENEIKAVLPDAQEAELPEIILPLPEADEITLSEEAFNIPAPISDSFPLYTQAAFFTKGIIGAGTMNHIIGDMTFYRVVAEPRFSLHFVHEKMDGYGNHNAGEGFFNREDALEASLSYINPALNFNSEASYSDTENGLQGNGNYSSLTHMITDVQTEFIYKALIPFQFSAFLSADRVNMILTGTDPVNVSEGNIYSNIGVDLVYSTFSFGLNTGYIFHTIFIEETIMHKADLSLNFKAELPFAMDIGGTGGICWYPDEPLYYPFSIYLQGVIKNMVFYRITGGVRLDDLTYSKLWMSYPLLSFHDQLYRSSAWYIDSSIEWIVQSGISIKGSGKYENITNAVSPLFESPDQSTGLFPFDLVPFSLLTFSAGAVWEQSNAFSLSLEWEGQVLDINPLKPDNRIRLHAGLKEGSGKYGTALDAVLNIYTELQMPEIKIESFYKITDDVTLKLELNDFLSPFLEGRTGWGNYEDPGISLVLKTNISL